VRMCRVTRVTASSWEHFAHRLISSLNTGLWNRMAIDFGPPFSSWNPY